MVRLGAPGTGFSSRDTGRSVETIAGLAARRRSSGGSSSRPTPTKNVRIQGGQVFINGQGFSVAPALQASFIQQQTGGSGASAQAALALVKQNKARADAAAKLQEAKAQAEKQKILKQRNVIIARGAREKVRTSRDARTGNKLRITEWQSGANKVRRVQDLTAGTVKYTSFGTGRGGGSARITGGVIAPGEKAPITFKLPKDFTKKINVTIPNDVKRMVENNKLSSAINNVKTTKQLNAAIQRDIKLGRASAFLLDVADIVSGGAITEKKINVDQAVLNNRIIKFNDKYNGRELSEAEYKKANAEQRFIESQQKKLDLRVNSLVSSKKNKVRNFYQSLSVQKTPRLTVQQQADVIKARNQNVAIQAQIKANAPTINRLRREIQTRETEIRRLQNKTNRSMLEELKIFRLKNKNNTAEGAIARLKFEAPPKIVAGTFPIIPASAIPSGISQVRFVGTQKVGTGGRIVTDLVFKTNKGVMGLARGVSTTVKGKTVSMVAGRFGRVTAKLMKGTRKLSKTRTFFGVEKGVVKSAKFTSDKLLRIAKFIQKEKKSGLLRVIKSNIKGMQQSGVGRVLTVRGRTFFKPFIRFPSGRLGAKLGKGIDLDDFASVSAILTKGDLSSIIGKTITLKGRKSEFIGMIKSLSGTGSKVIISVEGKQQYSKALQKLFTSVAAAVSKAERSGRFATKTLTLAGAASALSKTVPTVSSLKSAKTTLVKKQVKIKQTIQVKTIQRRIISKTRRVAVQKKKISTKQKSLVKQINNQKQKIKQLSRNKTKQARKQVNRIKQSLKINQKSLQKQKLKQKLATKQLLRMVTTPKPIVPRGSIRLPRIIIPKLPRGFTSKKLSKAQATFFVITKKKGKMVKLYPKPLTKIDARNFAVYSIDNNLTRTAFLSPLGKSKKVVKLPSKMSSYYSKNKRKVRPFKIRHGKRKQLLNGFIEKSKFIQDRPKEKAQMRRLRRKVKRKPIKRTPIKKRKSSSAIQKQRLRNLAKARAALKRKRKR